MNHVVTTVIGLIILFSSPIQAVHAQTQIEEIVVTARHRQESLQNVPIAITAFDAAKIEAAGITDIDGFINLTPNFIAREAFGPVLLS